MISRKPEQLFESAPAQRAGEPRGAYKQRENRILAAATHEFARAGYHETSMRTLAKTADVSLAGLYHYFSNKERLLFLIQFRTFSALLSNLREKLHGIDDPVEQLRVLARCHVSYFAENMAALKVCSHELDSLSDAAYAEIRKIRSEYYRLSRTIVERILQNYSAGNGIDPHVATMSLFGTLNWLYRWYDPKRDPSPTAVANQIANQFLTGVIGSPPVVRAQED